MCRKLNALANLFWIWIHSLLISGFVCLCYLFDWIGWDGMGFGLDRIERLFIISHINNTKMIQVPTIVPALKNLWRKDEAIMKAFNNRSKLQLPDSAE